MIPSLFGVIAFSLSLRLWPIWNSRKRGCDAYYYLLCAEEYRKNKKLPIVLPKLFLLDVTEQWYPPLFIELLSIIPTQWLKRTYWLITPAIDTLTSAMVWFYIYWQTGNP